MTNNDKYGQLLSEFKEAAEEAISTLKQFGEHSKEHKNTYAKAMKLAKELSKMEKSIINTKRKSKTNEKA